MAITLDNSSYEETNTAYGTPRSNARRGKSFVIILTLLSSVLVLAMNLNHLESFRNSVISNFMGFPLPYDMVAAPSVQTKPSHYRNFMTHPLTSEEGRRLSAKDPFNFTAAVCHPTIHGKLNSMGRFLAFVSYYRLLGFDHVFLWYEKESITRGSPSVWEGFNILANLSYVTMTEFVDDGRNAVYHGQGYVQVDCFSKPEFGASFDWVLVADADEFLWFDQNVTIKEFVSQNKNYTYISLGKWQYSFKTAIPLPDTEDAGFGLDRYPFTPGLYCYLGVGKEYCPDWIGRCKFLVKPSVHGATVDRPHGRPNVLKLPASIHYDHRKAHMKEWPFSIDVSHHTTNVTVVREPKHFLAKTTDDLGVHRLSDAFYPHLPNGTVLVKFDNQLAPWFHYVASNLPTVSNLSR